jgi:hypothetical protein
MHPPEWEERVSAFIITRIHAATTWRRAALHPRGHSPRERRFARNGAGLPAQYCSFGLPASALTRAVTLLHPPGDSELSGQSQQTRFAQGHGTYCSDLHRAHLRADADVVARPERPWFSPEANSRAAGWSPKRKQA